MQAEIKSNEETLLGLQKQQQDLEIISLGVDNNVSVAEYAMAPSRPFSPNPSRTLAIWLAIGMAVAVVVVLATARPASPTRVPPHRPAASAL